MEGQDSIHSPLVNLNHKSKEGKVGATDAEKMGADRARAEKGVVSKENVEAEEELEDEEERQVETGRKRMHMDPQLHMAVTKGDKDLVEQLLGSDAKVDARVKGEVAIKVVKGASSSLLGVTYAGETALHLAARFGHSELVELIYNKKRSLLEKCNTKLETPLHYAAKAGCIETVSYLIKHASDGGSDVLKGFLRRRNKDGETALHHAVFHRHESVVKELLITDPGLATMSDNQHISPLYLAVLRNSLPIVTTLVGSPCDDFPPSAYEGPKGQTALHAASLRDIDILRKMLDSKPELVNVVDESGSTPLHYAASHNLPGSVEALLGTDRSSAYTTDDSGLFPVHVAAQLGHVKVIEELFKQCPDSDKLLDSQGRNFLHLAVEKKKEAVVRWVCKHSNLIDPLNAQDNEGNTPIHLAVKAKIVGIFTLLLGNKNVDLCITNRNHWTPRDLVLTQFNHGIVWENSILAIIDQALRSAEYRHGVHRVDNLIGQQKLQMNPEKEEKALNTYENMAKSFGIISGLISSAAISAIFTVSAAYKADVLAGKSSDGLNLAFKAFIMVNTCAFLSSLTATILLVRASLIVVNPTYRIQYLTQSIELVNMGSKAFMAAFAVGVYVVVTPVSKWLAVLVCAVCCIVLILEPQKRPHRSIAWALFNRRKSWGELLEDGPLKYAISQELVFVLQRKLAFAFSIIIVLTFSNFKRGGGPTGQKVALYLVFIAAWIPCIRVLDHNGNVSAGLHYIRSRALSECWKVLVRLRSILSREGKKE